MKKFKVRIPRLVRMTEWETMIVEAEDKEQALNNALARENVIGDSSWEQEDWESIDEYLDDVEIMEEV
jgi:hypothetical protein